MASSYSLTPLQQAMYAAASLTGQPWQYVEQIVVRLAGERLEAPALALAMGDLFAAHEALNNVIVEDDTGFPRQRAVPAGKIPVATQDWDDLPSSQIEPKFRAFLQEDRARGVDATAGPAFRVTLFQTGAKGSILLWTFPHSLLDGRSFAPLLDEMFRHYAARVSGDPVPAPDPDRNNAFARHCQKLAAVTHAEGEAHFAKALAGWEGTEGLLRAGVKPGRKTECVLDFSEAETSTITAMAQQAGVKPSTVVLATWGIVLARSTGQSDVVFGNTRNGRNLVDGSPDAAGCFICTVPMRLRLEPHLTIGEVLAELRAEQIAVRHYEHTPLTQIRRCLGIPQGRQLFDSLVMFDNGTLEEQVKRLGDHWADRSVELHEEGDMPVSVAAYMGPRLRIVVEYDPAQVPNGAALGSGLKHFLQALKEASTDTSLGAISMLGAEETARLHALAGAEIAAAPDETCINRFETGARTAPDKEALLQIGGTSLTYGALDQAATKLAGKLVAAGAAPGDLIGICMARSPEFITAILAIWKAGAAFVPMDPSYPGQTLNIIAQDSDARLILTDATSPALDAPTFALSELPQEGAELPAHQGRSPEDLAYVIFTSGSTGRPKGVMITHRSLAAHADAVIPKYGLNPQDRVLQFAALSFDVALEEIIPTLLCGATLVLRSDEMAKSVATFLEQVNNQHITVTNLPTGFWIALTEVLDSRALRYPPEVRLVIVGGERVPMSVLKRWRARVPNVRWMNGYGPTETTITCTAHEISDDDLAAESVPIGGPMAHARAWVLGKDGALVPPGVEGELFISGHAVAKGYLNSPEQTAKAFVQAPFDRNIGRVYATGDRVSWQNGVLHFLGRTDKQIKLRGFRIEPGQIEAAVEAHPMVDRAHADVVETDAGQTQLVAWYSAPDGASLPEPADIKAVLANSLPPQMQPIPVGVTHWPHTAGGKLDVARLPSPDTAQPDPQDHHESDSPVVRKVAEIFAKILRVEQVSPATSFFDAGGDSLSLLRLMPELQSAFDVRLEPTAIYNDSSPRGVAQALLDKDHDPLVMIPIQPNGSLPPLYGVHVLGDNGSFFRPLAQVLGPDQPVLGVTVGLLSKDTPTSVEGIAAFYRKQIERHAPDGPLSLIAVSAGSYVTLELAHQLLAAGRDVQALILLDAEGPDGRARVGRLSRLFGHFSLLMEQGPSYIRKQRALRKEMHVQDAARLRLVALAKQPESETEVFNVDEFVAANMLAIEAYQPQPYPRRLTIYRAGDDRFDSKQALETGLGWASVAQAGFDLSDVPGDHLGILEQPNVATLGAKVSALLKKLRT